MKNSWMHRLNPFSFNHRSLGLEITDKKLKLVEMIVQKDRATITNVAMEPLPTGTVDDGKLLNPSKVIQTLQSAIAQKDIIAKHVHLVIPSQLVMVRFLKLPDIPLKDLAKVVDFEMKHNIHLPFEQPVYDFVKLNGNDGKQKIKPVVGNKHSKQKFNDRIEEDPLADIFRLTAAASESSLLNVSGDVDAISGPQQELLQCDVMLVAAPKAAVDEYSEIVEAAGLKLNSIEFKALSLYRLIEFTGSVDPDGTFLLVDINSAASDVSIFHRSQLKITRSVPLNFSIDKPIVKEQQEEDLSFGFNDPQADFHNHCSELAHELERLMNFYRYTLNNRNHEFHQLALSGDVPRLFDVAQYLEERMSIEVKIISSPKIQLLSGAVTDPLSAFAVSAGLALRGNSR